MLLGVASSWALAHTLSGLLFGVTSTDPTTFAAMLLLLTAVAALADYLPAPPASTPWPPSASADPAHRHKSKKAGVQ